METLTPKDHGEAVAVFRHALIGRLCARELEHGELAEALRIVSQERVRPPDSARTRTFAVPTLERWLYAYRARPRRPASPRAHRPRAGTRSGARAATAPL
jgi:putative transposase